jgi:hypothetical protein
MEAVFRIEEISLGTINHLRTEVSESLSEAVSEASTYLQGKPIPWADEA